MSESAGPSLPDDPATRSPYDVPFPYGRAAGTESTSSVAAPLLAGGALASIGIVVQQEDAVRWPGVTLTALIASVLLLVTAVQCGAWARRYGVTPDDVWQWWPEANAARRQEVIEELRQAGQSQRIWAARFHINFNLGILLLWLALALVAAPTAGSQQPVWRWVAAGLALAGALLQILWIFVSGRLSHRHPLTRWLFGERPRT